MHEISYYSNQINLEENRHPAWTLISKATREKVLVCPGQERIRKLWASLKWCTFSHPPKKSISSSKSRNHWNELKKTETTPLKTQPGWDKEQNRPCIQKPRKPEASETSSSQLKTIQKMCHIQHINCHIKGRKLFFLFNRSWHIQP